MNNNFKRNIIIGALANILGFGDIVSAICIGCIIQIVLFACGLPWLLLVYYIYLNLKFYHDWMKGINELIRNTHTVNKYDAGYNKLSKYSEMYNQRRSKGLSLLFLVFIPMETIMFILGLWFSQFVNLF